MQIAPKFGKAVIPLSYHPVKTKMWKKAMAAFEAQKYEQAFEYVIAYLHPRKKIVKDVAGGKEIIIPHGCLHLHLMLTKDTFSIRVPFLKAITPAVGLLSQVVRLNANQLSLPQIYFKDGEFFFYFASPLALCHPNKVYELMRQMCQIGDSYAEEWANEFGAELAEPSFVYTVAPDLQEKAWQQFQTQLEQADKYVAYFDEKHWEDLGWMFFAAILRYFIFAFNPRGKLLRELSQDIDMFLQDMPDHKKMGMVPDLLKKYRDFSKEDFTKCLYVPHLFCLERTLCKLEYVKKDMQNCYNHLMKARPSPVYGTIYIWLCLFRLAYTYDLAPGFRQLLNSATRTCSSLEWEKAYNKLFHVVRYIINLRRVPPTWREIVLAIVIGIVFFYLRLFVF